VRPSEFEKVLPEVGSGRVDLVELGWSAGRVYRLVKDLVLRIVCMFVHLSLPPQPLESVPSFDIRKYLSSTGEIAQ